jgi:hypothetical protein
MNDTTPTQHTEFVLRRFEDPLHLFGRELDGRVWLAVLIPVLMLALFYVIFMYRRDARSVGGWWATFLGALRVMVYAVLAAVFLLPALQSWEETKQQSKVVLLFDVSGSMGHRDDYPTPTTPVEQLPTRQDKVLDLLENSQAAFLSRLQQKNPIYGYRFGGLLDDNFTVHANAEAWTRAEWEERLRRLEKNQEIVEGKAWLREDWSKWLKPEMGTEPDNLNEDERAVFRKQRELIARLQGGTNVGDSTLAVLNREINNMPQAIVVFSDGHSTEGSPQAFRDLADRARKAKVPIFVVAVGQDRPPIRIDITDVQAPEQARPEDKFPVRVEVNGEGLANREVTVFLDIIRPNKEKLAELQKTIKFAPGSPPHAQAEFEIEAEQFAQLKGEQTDSKKKAEFEEGEWKLVARVAKDKQEIYLKPEHVSDPAIVRIVKRPLRILLFAGAPMHEYQFLRTLFVREDDMKRAELSIYLQPAPGQTSRRPGIVQDVANDRFLTQFPFRLQSEAEDKPDEKPYNLAAYDLIIAFDPDWTQLTQDQLSMVERWVGTHAGGLILINGPVNTVQLARPGSRERLKPIIDLYPVLLLDNRTIDLDRNPVEPWRLNFPGATPEMEFLRLDEEQKDVPLAGWEEFFTGYARGQAPQGAPTLRGFYNYYPVEKAKDSATVIATFSDPRSRLLANGKEHPYIVSMPYGSGKVVWIGSGEMRRLRQYREAYFERFWTKLARYAGAGNLNRLNQRIVLVMGRTFSANNYINVEAQAFGRDMLPLSQNSQLDVVFKLPVGVFSSELADPKNPPKLLPKPGSSDWNGWFAGRFLVRAAGEYGIEIKVRETGDTVSGKFIVKETNPELDNARPDFDALYAMASEADDVLARVDSKTQKELKQYLQRPVIARQPEKAESEVKESDKLRLFFDLKGAEMIPDCMVTDRRDQKSRGPVKDLWDDGYVTVQDAAPPLRPVKLITVLSIVVTLLSIEWLTRKLLRLA